MAAPKRTRTEREEVLAQVAKLDRRGYSQNEIARLMGVSQVQVCYDLKKVRKRYQETQVYERKELVREKLAQYAELRREAWEAWEKSKEASRRVVMEQEVWDNGPTVTDDQQPVGDDDDTAPKPRKSTPQRRRKKQVTKEGQCGDTQYLIVIAKCLQAERELQALDPVKQLEVQSTNVNWDVLFARTSTPSSIERELKEIESQVEQLARTPGSEEPPVQVPFYTQDSQDLDVEPLDPGAGNGHTTNGYHDTDEPEEPVG